MARQFYIFILFLMLCTTAVAQNFTLSGRVTDDNGDALEMATVTLLPQLKVTFTNLKG